MTWPRKRASIFQQGQVAYLHVDQALRDVDLIVRLQNYVFFRVSLFDDALEVHRKILAVFPGYFNLAFVCKITKTTGPNNGLTSGVRFISRNLLRALAFYRTVNINLSTRFFTHPIQGQN